MAIVKGFPSSICCDMPSKRTCALCGKEWWESFPIGLQLDISDDVNFSILACPECYQQDQGCDYWSSFLSLRKSETKNKWGDNFHIYSKAREGYSSWAILLTHRNHQQWPMLKKRGKIRKKIYWDESFALSESRSDIIESLYASIVNGITGFCSPWRETGTVKTNVPSTLVITAA